MVITYIVYGIRKLPSGSNILIHGHGLIKKIK